MENGRAGVPHATGLRAFGAAISPESFSACTIELLDLTETDSLVVITVHTSLQDIENVNDPIERLVEEQLDRPMAIVHSSAHGEVDTGGVGGSATFDSTERALSVLPTAHRYGAWRRAVRANVPFIDESTVSDADRLVRGALARYGNQPTWLSVGEARELLGMYDISAPQGEMATTFSEAKAAAVRAGFPVTLRTADPSIVHQSDPELVIARLSTLRDVHDAVEKLRTRVGRRRTPIMVQHHVDAGVEIAVGLVRDRRFGPLVMVSAAGTATDVLNDRAFLMPPLSNLKAESALRSLLVWPLLAGDQGSSAADIESLTSLMEKLARLGQEVPEVCEVDFNPVIATPQGIHCVDVKIRVEPADERSTAGIPRTLGRLRLAFP